MTSAWLLECLLLGSSLSEYDCHRKGTHGFSHTLFFFFFYHATKPLLTFLTEVQLLLKRVISKLKLGQMARVQSNAISARRECRLKN